MAAVAAAIQQMRIWGEEKMRLDAAYPHVSVLDTRNYLGARFNDDVLRLAILRAATPAELEHWSDRREENRRELCGRLLHNHENQSVFPLELAIARLAKKIPQPELVSEDGSKLTGWAADLWSSFNL